MNEFLPERFDPNRHISVDMVVRLGELPVLAKLPEHEIHAVFRQCLLVALETPA